LLDVAGAPPGTYHSDGRRQFRENELPLQRALRGETISDLDIVVRNRFRPEGVWLRIRANPVTDASGQVKFAVCAFTDISAAHVSEQRDNIFRQVFAQTQEAIIITDATFIVQFANQAYWDLTGELPDKTLDRPFSPQEADYNEGSSWVEMQNICRTEGAGLESS